MPQIVGVRERLDQTLYSGWIADTRPGGIGVSHEAQFRPHMRLFMTDIGDRLRTNMVMSGALPCDRTARILKMGFHVSFTHRGDFDLFFGDKGPGSMVGSLFEIKTAGNSAGTMSTEGQLDAQRRPCVNPTYQNGIRILEERPKPIAIPSRMGFHVELWTGPKFTERMQAIESGKEEAYAEVKCLLDVIMTREVS